MRREGNTLLDQGRLPAAADRYREAIALDPAHAAARVNLGFVLLELGQVNEAAACLEAALDFDAGNVDALYMLGSIARQRGEADAARHHFGRALELRPAFEGASLELGKLLFEAGEPALAAEVVDRGLAHQPGSADLRVLRGDLHLREGQAREAQSLYGGVLADHPDYAPVWLNLARAHRRVGDLPQAAALLRRFVAAFPDHAQARYEFATALHETGDAPAAIEQLHALIAQDPGHFDAHVFLGIVLASIEQAEAAARSYRRALEIRPDSAQALCNLGITLANLGDVSTAIECNERALSIDPAHAPAHGALAVAYNHLGQVGRAAESTRRCLALKPDDLQARGNLLFFLSFLSTTPDDVEQARRFGEACTARATPSRHEMPELPEVLRIGFVSGDFKQHPVAFFLEGVIRGLRGGRVELFAYSNCAVEDAVTARLRPMFGTWRSIVGMHDAVAARRIRDDDLHVLVDLSGHTANNRLPVFAYRPAPLQVTWLGYWASTGVQEMDYLLADPLCLPPGTEHLYTERIWRLPHTRLCFTPPQSSAPPVSPLPAQERGHVTFASFQRLAKITDGVLALWGRILAALPGARLMLQSQQFSDASVLEEVRARLEAAGVPADRTCLRPATGYADYLAAYGEVDIVLDSFPYTGGTTTCEALWMGVPTLTLSGTTMLERQGQALLGCVGLDDWVAKDADDYVRLALSHATDLPALATLRAGLRERARVSPIFDAARLAADLEQAVRGMWAETRRARIAAAAGEGEAC